MQNSIANLILAGRITYEHSLNSAHSGNISYRRDTGERYVITRSGAMLGHLTESDIVHLSVQNAEIHRDHDQPDPSRELPVHLEVYRQNPLAKAIIHIHSHAATVLSSFFDVIIPEDAEGKYYLPHIPVCRFENPIGSTEMAHGVAGALQHAPAMIVRSHGVFAIGKDLGEALLYAHCADSICSLLLSKKIYSATTGLPELV